MSEFFNLTKCTTNSEDLKKLLDFLKQHDNLVVVPEDKGNSVNLMYLSDYKQKIADVFSDPSKFTKT